ncbi:hypothetical protein C4D60_Mb01t20720 [Musa balbisiana]|uniref:Protein kinase domain-containing protein n=1 Tax=Musa balbisiana TaxID=52838 RepID=A0A4S8JNX9_MUSBA|nr:hypothetical protein C4D60_Mb01t20720 [Musa balbisiana]
MEVRPVSPRCDFYLFFLLSVCLPSSFLRASAAVELRTGDFDALLALKSSIDPHDSLPWRQEAVSELCGGWKGVKQCSPDGRVTKLVVEFLNLTGTLLQELLAPLDQLRVLSFKANSLSGAIPDLSPLVNLKSLFLSDNQFSGRIPVTIASLHRLKVIVLSHNLLSGPIPTSLAGLPRLHALLLQDNRLMGEIPALNQPSLLYLNVSGNNLSGEIPATRSLSRFSRSSFLGNPNLCGDQIGAPCTQKLIFPPPTVSPKSSFDQAAAASPSKKAAATAEEGEGRVLVVEFLNLTGTLLQELLAPLDQLRVLSFKANSLSGAIPDLSPLVNLKSLFLSDNQFSGRIPVTIASLHRLKVIVLSHNLLSGPIPDLSPLVNLKSLFLSDNQFSGRIPVTIASLHRLKVIVLSHNLLSGPIPTSLAGLPRLHALLLQDNRLMGEIPALNQPSLLYLNVSGNNLSGEIPATRSLSRFSRSSFLGNPNLCGDQIGAPCTQKLIFPPPTVSPKSSFDQKEKKSNREPIRRTRIRRPQQAPRRRQQRRRRRGKGGFSWEVEDVGKLVFCGGAGEMYSLEELLRASAETLGRGTVGSTYKAVMESGFIVTVKRLKDASRPPAEEFRRRMEELGRLRHPNLVPFRSRPSGSGKPLHWTSCLKIAEDVAAGLLYLHQTNPPTVHADLKPSNVLLGPDFESCLTDYGLIAPLLPASHDDLSAPSPSSSSSSSAAAAAVFYRAPESRLPNPAFTPLSDVYSFGVLLLELLTGKTPMHDLVEERGADIPRWVRSVRKREKNDSGEDPGPSEEKLTALLDIAVACVAVEAEKRPPTEEVLRMIREARAEVVASSNSSDHSPGRWSDTLQSLPRENGP